MSFCWATATSDLEDGSAQNCALCHLFFCFAVWSLGYGGVITCRLTPQHVKNHRWPWKWCYGTPKWFGLKPPLQVASSCEEKTARHRGPTWLFLWRGLPWRPLHWFNSSSGFLRERPLCIWVVATAVSWPCMTNVIEQIHQSSKKLEIQDVPSTPLQRLNRRRYSVTPERWVELQPGPPQESRFNSWLQKYLWKR